MIPIRVPVRVAACWLVGLPLAATAAPAALVDHHVHVLGPDLLRDWKSLGVPFSREDAAYLSASRYFEPLEGGEAGAPLDAAILVPMAHLYGRQSFREALRLSLEVERERVARENDHVAREAHRSGPRTVAFCSVPLLRPYTWEEIARCRAELGSPGLKLHLAASGVDPANDAHLAEVERVAAWAAREGVALLLHFDPQREDLDAGSVDHFLATVLEPHPRLEVIVAHLGGSGGYGSQTQVVLRRFASWLARQAAAGEPRPGVNFDLSAVILAEPSEGVPATTAEEAAGLAAELRALGLERIVFGSDAPVFEPRAYAALLAERGGLTPAELDSLLARRAPVLARAVAASD